MLAEKGKSQEECTKNSRRPQEGIQGSIAPDINLTT